MVGFGKRGTKVAPHTYPKLPFHGLRALQLLSSLIVGSIMVYFIYYLSHDHWNIPWTFVFFTAASGTTVIALCTTIILHCCFGLNPRFNLFINGGLFMLWGAAFGMLSWWASKTLTHRCKVEDWNDETGVMVCRIYKALYAFGCCGFVSTLCALVLDVIVWKRATRLGNFTALNDDKATVVPYNDVDLPTYNRSQPAENPATGYGVPEEQFGYDDTHYHGAHPPQARYA
ncbi:hypothetical protein BLS_005205 [Venturia inaequalis]|uniref:MARVEL domain-containing protein n=1 Tax=Venturia inaequalis TaxID=5025 RepID=A0A8H3UGW9_VENIN|nr:hypothetical protein BLS_005205 [Venturia inaequalis]RDI86053.1 hypothetical protein Vi05172_g4159 [Venturia inaequalis]